MTSAADLLPHRAPFILVDRVIEASPGKVRAEKQVTAGDPLVGDLLPDMLVIEALAQACACSNRSEQGPHLGYLVAITNFTFEGRVATGETLTLDVTRAARLGPLSQFDVEAAVCDRPIARGRMTFSVPPRHA
jgi:3-hydroxyacyl-[acyl-carrier-protein] dehydratase